MSRRVEDGIRSAFEDEYQAPLRDLRLGLRQPRRPRRYLGAALARVGALVVVAVVALALGLPRVTTPHTDRIGSGAHSDFSPVLPLFGYRVAATVQDLNGRAEQETLGVVPPGHRSEVITQSRCAGSTDLPITYRPHSKFSMSNVLFGVESPDGHLALFATAPGGTLDCHSAAVESELNGTVVDTMVAPRKGDRPQRLSLISGSGVDWRVVLAISRSARPAVQLPARLGSCSSKALAWDSTAMEDKGAVEFRLSTFSNSVSACRLNLPVRLGLYLGGTEKPLEVSGNRSVASIAVPISSETASSPLLTWRWSNWCGASKPVQAAFFGPGGAILPGPASTQAVPVPTCEHASRPSRLVFVPST